MCGIAGIMTRTDSARQRAINRMIASIGHRGIDGEGLHIARVALAQVRLAIIDLELAINRSTSPAVPRLVANAEIYNYRELHEFTRNQVFETFRL